MRSDTAQIPWMEALLVHPIQNPVHTATEHCYGYRLTYNGLQYGGWVDGPITAELDYQAAAVDGDPIALNNLGCLRAHRATDPHDRMIAARILAASEAMGCTVAAVNAGMMWEDLGDDERAYTCYRRAYMQGDPIGQFCYAGFYEHGRYVEQDAAFAYRLYLMLAQEHYGDAYGRVAHMLQEGRGVPQDLQAAVTWYRRGEACGDRDCTYELGMCYYKGRGVTRNADKAATLLERAMHRGDTRACEVLGITVDQEHIPQIPDDDIEDMDSRHHNSWSSRGLTTALAAYHQNPCMRTRRGVIRAILRMRLSGERGGKFYRPFYGAPGLENIEPLLPVPDDPTGRKAVPIIYHTPLQSGTIGKELEQQLESQYGELGRLNYVYKGWTTLETALLGQPDIGGVVINPADENCYLPIEIIQRLQWIEDLQNTTSTEGNDEQ